MLLKSGKSVWRKDKGMVIHCCDGTVDGILTAVFDAWATDIKTSGIAVSKCCNMVMFAEYREVVTDCEKAARVTATVVNKISRKAYEMVYYACLAPDEDRGDCILQFIRKGMRMGGAVTEDLQEHSVMRVFRMMRNATREMQHFCGFTRFVQHGDYLLARIEPRNDLLVPLADFFADRLMQENYAIVDMARGKAAVHRAGQDFFVTEASPEDVERIAWGGEEKEISGLWEVFEKSISIEARYNPGLQQQNMPLRYRKYMKP